MRKREITSILLIAGTCIGGGTIALPMVLAKIGIIPSVLITIAIWLLNYYPSLSGVELNLRSDRGMSLGELGRKISGNGAQAIGEISVKTVSFASLAIHLCGSSSIIHKLVEEYLHYDMSVLTIESCLAAFGIVILLLPFRMISIINNIMFTCLITVFFTLLCSMISLVDCSKMPWTMTDVSIKNCLSVCPIIFTSYGYQLILHTLRDYGGKNSALLRKSVFFGGLIPTLVYILWSSSSLSVVFKANSDFFAQMVAGNISVGDFVKELANASSMPNFQILVWWMSIMSILTSYLGVSLGLAESINLSLKNHMREGTLLKFLRKPIAAILTIIPAYIVSAMYPDAFIKILGFAGVLFVIIGISLPTYLLFKDGMQKLYFKELKQIPLIISFIAGLVIMAAEIFINN